MSTHWKRQSGARALIHFFHIVVNKQQSKGFITLSYKFATMAVVSLQYQCGLLCVSPWPCCPTNALQEQVKEPEECTLLPFRCCSPKLTKFVNAVKLFATLFELSNCFPHKYPTCLFTQTPLCVQCMVETTFIQHLKTYTPERQALLFHDSSPSNRNAFWNIAFLLRNLIRPNISDLTN